MLNASIMIIVCPACASRYVVPDSAIGVEGRTVRCAKCRHSWFQDGPELAAAPPSAQEPPRAPAPPAPAPTPVSVQPVTPPPEPEPVVPPASTPVPAPEAEVEPIAQAVEQPEAAPAPPSPATDWQLATGDDFVPSEPPPPISFRDESLSPSREAVIPAVADDYEPGESRFRHEPLFGARRNPAKMWMIAAILFAVVTLGGVAATSFYGLPDWVPFAKPMFAEEQPGLKLNFPDKQQGHRELTDKTWIFEVNGTVTNISQTSLSVPTILMVLRDSRGREAYKAEIVAPKRVLAPGESVEVREALTQVPLAGKKAAFGWKPGN